MNQAPKGNLPPRPFFVNLGAWPTEVKNYSPRLWAVGTSRTGRTCDPPGLSSTTRPDRCPTDILPRGHFWIGTPAPLPRGNVQSGNPPDARENPMENGHRPPRGEPASASGLDYGTSVRIAPETNLMAQIWAGCPRKMLAPSAVPPFNPIPR